MLRNKKGFTLVELLAVIVILAIILAIAVPTISSLILSQRTAAFEANVKMLLKGIDYKYLENPTTNTAAALTTAGAVGLGGVAADYSTFTVVATSPASITLVGSSTGKFKNCAVTGATMTSVTVSGCSL